MAVVEQVERRTGSDEETWSERAEVAIAVVSAYQEDAETPGAAPAPERAAQPGRVGPVLFLATCVAVELAWLALLARLLQLSGAFALFA